ncbi:hypothetical protein [Pseudobdellovibrio exovorus]|uniref:Uncharacterized protein n=1 Tax=Pseudobdellovibrio exovorus JSS TaxID=1184267 RepID=M4V7H2_9BACT|nr:hypothetical protein [Pseudobdellovibrio exovorus]AGH94385.1 hypothetical protein A11Q_165 [Pseudobdellovibrio exovorus JSS]
MKTTLIVALTTLLGLASWVNAANLRYSQVSCNINRSQLTINVAQNKVLLDGKKLANVTRIKANNTTLTLTLDNPQVQDIHTVQVKIPNTIKYGEIDRLMVIQTDYMDFAQASSYDCVVTE